MRVALQQLVALVTLAIASPSIAALDSTRASDDDPAPSVIDLKPGFVTPPARNAITEGLVRFDAATLDAGAIPADVRTLHTVTMTNTSPAPIRVTSITLQRHWPGPIDVSMGTLDAIAPGASIDLSLPLLPRHGYRGAVTRHFTMMIDREVPAEIVVRAHVAELPGDREAPTGALLIIRELPADDPMRTHIAAWKPGDPAMVLDPPERDFGRDVLPGIKLPVPIRVVNVSDHPVMMTKLIPGGSSAMVLSGEAVPPAHCATFSWPLYPPPNSDTNFRKLFTLQLDKEPPVFVKSIGRTARIVEIMPAKMCRPTMWQIERFDAHTDFIVRSIDGAPLRIMSVRPASPIDFDPEPKPEQVVCVKWLRMNKARLPFALELEIDHGVRHRELVALLPPRDAREDGLVRIDPPEPTAGDIPFGDSVLQSMTLTNTSAYPIHVTSITSEGMELIPVPSSNAIAPGASIVLSVPMTQPTDLPGAFMRSFTVMIDDEVPVIVNVFGRAIAPEK